MKKQILWDCHMHSSFSADSETPMEDMIQAAISRNLSGICFTEHFDPDYPADPEGLIFDLDIPAYHTKLCQLKEKYRARIDEFFYYHDKNNSERVYQAVKGLEKQELRSRK